MFGKLLDIEIEDTVASPFTNEAWTAPNAKSAGSTVTRMVAVVEAVESICSTTVRRELEDPPNEGRGVVHGRIAVPKRINPH